jgi:hypothetical protein
MHFRFMIAAFALLGSAIVSEAAPPSCKITFRLGTSTPLISTSAFAIYQNAPGEFAGTGTGVDCDLLASPTGQISDADQTRTLVITAQGSFQSPINGPKTLAECTWLPTTRFPVAGDFDLSGQSGFNLSFQSVNANITITTIDCSGTISTTTTTTTSTTTTTLPQLCGDFDDNGTIQTSDALNVLKASVGQKPCALCLCDLDGNGVKSATDALVCLKTAVGIAVQLKCPACN